MTVAINRINFNRVSRYCYCTSLTSQATSPTQIPLSSSDSSTPLTHSMIKDSLSLIGLDVKCKLNTSSKLFSRSPTNYFVKENDNLSLYDAAIPGTLPVINRRCLELAIKTGLAFNCEINTICSFDRQHLLTSDLPSGYRLIQYREPIARNGYIKWFTQYRDNQLYRQKTIPLQSISLEEENGKTSVDLLEKVNFINLNDRGLPLLKFSFEPTIMLPSEAHALVKELMFVMKRLKAFNGRLEEEALTVEASVQLLTSTDNHPLGEPVTITNIKSYYVIKSALAFEISRQRAALRKKWPIKRVTEVYNKYIGRPKRLWQEQFDPRLMVEPSIPQFKLIASELDNNTISRANYDNNDQVGHFSIAKLTSELPSLPEKERDILINQYGIPIGNVVSMVRLDYYNFFVKFLDSDPSLDPNNVVDFILSIISNADHKAANSLDSALDRIEYFVELYHLLNNQIVTEGTAYKMAILWIEGDQRSPEQIIKENQWTIITDEAIIADYCKKVMEDRIIMTFLLKRGDTQFLKSLRKKIETACDHRIPPEKIVSTVEQLIDSIPKDLLAACASRRNLPKDEKPPLFGDEPGSIN